MGGFKQYFSESYLRGPSGLPSIAISCFCFVTVGWEGPGPGAERYQETLWGVIGEGNTFSPVCKLRWNLLNMKIIDNIWTGAADIYFL